MQNQWVFFTTAKSLKGFGERGRNRTFNLLIKSQLLCQLSYAPFSGISCGKGLERAQIPQR